ncbi:hypothetical protein [Actinospongicola halichondriae]|uniref:hypothetical protein n=1 Tax=Actinospongicola halichondriae TaxID=3236844 RepID=UPI003D4DF545
METRRWINHSLPQALGNAVMLLYVSAAFDALFGAVFNLFGLAIVVGKVAAGYLIANERKVGYQLGLVMAFSPFVLRFVFLGGLNGVLGTGILSLMFEVLLVALLLHEQSREHQRIWFS